MASNIELKWHSGPVSSKGSLASHIYSNTGHPFISFIMVIFENSWQSHLSPTVWQWNCHCLFLRRMSVAAGIQTPNLPHERRTLYPTAPPWRSIWDETFINVATVWTNAVLAISQIYLQYYFNDWEITKNKNNYEAVAWQLTTFSSCDKLLISN